MPTIRNTPFLSVIIPTLNEGAELIAFIQNVQRILVCDTQIIIVDGGSQDGSLALLSELEKDEDNINVISSAKGRAIQMNAGAAQAKGECLLFLHADTQLPDSAFVLLKCFLANAYSWGRFDVRLNNPAWCYKVISWFMNHRSRLSAIATGDQAIFVLRRVFEQINGYAPQPLMEDIDLSARLRRHSKPYCIKAKVLTSARKWEQGGVLQTIWLMWKLRAAYACGTSPEVLVKQYYTDV